MVESTDTFLERRHAALLADEQTVPFEYDELREEAREHLDAGTYDYAAGGAGTEDTVRANRGAFRRYRILTRVLRDVSDRSLGIELFGREAAAPLVLAPVGGQELYHRDGELATARAARNLDVPVALSSSSSRSIEDVAEASEDGPRLFQLYWPEDWEVAASLIRRAGDAGFDGIVLTVDSQLPTWRIRNFRNSYRTGVAVPKAVFESDPVVQERARTRDVPVSEYVADSPDLDKDASLTWEDLDTLRGWTDLPIVLKGILTDDDARRASEWGADGIVVSNHGGRQIDGAVAALNQLPALIDAVDDDTSVVFDSGVRNGSDVFKALALGADAVQIGRPYVYGLAIAGQRGVEATVLNLLAELESVMGLAGFASVDQIDRRALVERTHRPSDGCLPEPG